MKMTSIEIIGFKAHFMIIFKIVTIKRYHLVHKDPNNNLEILYLENLPNIFVMAVVRVANIFQI